MAKRPPKLQETREFVESVSSAAEGGMLDHKLIANDPKSPGKNPNLQPPNVARGHGGQLDFSE